MSEEKQAGGARSIEIDLSAIARKLEIAEVAIKQRNAIAEHLAGMRFNPILAGIEVDDAVRKLCDEYERVRHDLGIRNGYLDNAKTRLTYEAGIRVDNHSEIYGAIYSLIQQRNNAQATLRSMRGVDDAREQIEAIRDYLANGLKFVSSTMPDRIDEAIVRLGNAFLLAGKENNKLRDANMILDQDRSRAVDALNRIRSACEESGFPVSQEEEERFEDRISRHVYNVLQFQKTEIERIYGGARSSREAWKQIRGLLKEVEIGSEMSPEGTINGVRFLIEAYRNRQADLNAEETAHARTRAEAEQWKKNHDAEREMREQNGKERKILNDVAEDLFREMRHLINPNNIPSRSEVWDEIERRCTEKRGRPPLYMQTIRLREALASVDLICHLEIYNEEKEIIELRRVDKDCTHVLRDDGIVDSEPPAASGEVSGSPAVFEPLPEFDGSQAERESRPVEEIAGDTRMQYFCKVLRQPTLGGCMAEIRRLQEIEFERNKIAEERDDCHEIISEYFENKINHKVIDLKSRIELIIRICKSQKAIIKQTRMMAAEYPAIHQTLLSLEPANFTRIEDEPLAAHARRIILSYAADRNAFRQEIAEAQYQISEAGISEGDLNERIRKLCDEHQRFIEIHHLTQEAELVSVAGSIPFRLKLLFGELKKHRTTIAAELGEAKEYKAIIEEVRETLRVHGDEFGDAPSINDACLRLCQTVKDLKMRRNIMDQANQVPEINNILTSFEPVNFPHISGENVCDHARRLLSTYRARLMEAGSDAERIRARDKQLDQMINNASRSDRGYPASRVDHLELLFDELKSLREESGSNEAESWESMRFKEINLRLNKLVNTHAPAIIEGDPISRAENLVEVLEQIIRERDEDRRDAFNRLSGMNLAPSVKDKLKHEATLAENVRIVASEYENVRSHADGLMRDANEDRVALNKVLGDVGIPAGIKLLTNGQKIEELHQRILREMREAGEARAERERLSKQTISAHRVLTANKIENDNYENELSIRILRLVAERDKARESFDQAEEQIERARMALYSFDLSQEYRDRIRQASSLVEMIDALNEGRIEEENEIVKDCEKVLDEAGVLDSNHALEPRIRMLLGARDALQKDLRDADAVVRAMEMPPFDKVRMEVAKSLAARIIILNDVRNAHIDVLCRQSAQARKYLLKIEEMPQNVPLIVQSRIAHCMIASLLREEMPIDSAQQRERKKMIIRSCAEESSRMYENHLRTSSPRERMESDPPIISPEASEDSITIPLDHTFRSKVSPAMAEYILRSLDFSVLPLERILESIGKEPQEAAEPRPFDEDECKAIARDLLRQYVIGYPAERAGDLVLGVSAEDLGRTVFEMLNPQGKPRRAPVEVTVRAQINPEGCEKIAQNILNRFEAIRLRIGAIPLGLAIYQEIQKIINPPAEHFGSPVNHEEASE